MLLHKKVIFKRFFSFQVIEFEGKAAKFKEIEKEHSKIGNTQNLQNRIKELEQELSYQTERSNELEIKNSDLSKFKH